MADPVKMFEVNSDAESYGFRSAGGTLTMYRDPAAMWNWILCRNGAEIDRDRYRHDLAGRNNLHLRYSDNRGGWEN